MMTIRIYLYLATVLYSISIAFGQSAPANDAFATRIDLGSAVSFSVEGSTVGASLEEDENDLDLLGGASVWWTWTAPMTGYVSLDTKGSAIDTVLGVFTDGPTLADTATLGFNDESLSLESAPGESQVVFMANVGSVYHFAVHGFLGEQGTVALNLHFNEPLIRLTALSLNAPSVNVTSGAGAVIVDLGISSDADFSEGHLLVHRPGFQILDSVPFGAANRLSGGPQLGVYRVTVPVPRYAAPGTWLIEVALLDVLGREATFGRGVSALFEYDHVMPDGVAALFSVVNTGAQDSTPPTISTFSMTPGSVNVATTVAPITFQFHVDDDLSGFEKAILRLEQPSGEALTQMALTSASRILGTALNGTYQSIFTFPAKMPSGEWVAKLVVYDATGNLQVADPVGFSVIGVAHAYWAWMYPLTSGVDGANPNDDWDGDGFSNLIEYAFGTNPSVNDSPNPDLISGADFAGAPLVTLTQSDQLQLEWVRRKEGNGSGLTYEAQFSSTLQEIGDGAWTTTENHSIVGNGVLFERVQTRDQSVDLASGRRFARIRVMLNDQ